MKLNANHFKKAFDTLIEKEQLKQKHILLLQTHLAFPGQKATATQIAKKLNYKSYQGVNSLYGKLAYRICDELDKIGEFPQLKRFYKHKPDDWILIFLKEPIKNNSKGQSLLSLKNEVKEALKDIKSFNKDMEFKVGKVKITGFWTFFCNPAKWQIDDFLLKGKKLDSFEVTAWQAKYFEPGQLGVIRVGKDRRTKKVLGDKEKLEAGVYAIVKVLSKASPRGNDRDEHWVNPKEIKPNKNRVKIKYLKSSLNQPLLIQDLRKIKGVADSYLINGFQASSMPLKESSFNKIVEKFGKEVAWTNNELKATVNGLDALNLIQLAGIVNILVWYG